MSSVAVRIRHCRAGPMDLGKRRQDTQFLKERTLGLPCARINRLPIDGGAVQNGAGEIIKSWFARVHVSFPQRDARARAAPSYAPLLRSVCPASQPPLHSCSPTRRGR